jgi:hypothetical protein
MSNCQTDRPDGENGKQPKYTALGLALILLLGFGIRTTGLAWGQAFCYGSQGDCLGAYTVAVDYALGQPRAQYIGQPNFNRHAKLPGPLWAMFCEAGRRWGGSLDGVVWAVILLNSAVIYLTYLLAARTVGFPAALWAALFVATSPKAVEYSAVIFNPVVMPFLGALLSLALWRVTQRDGSRAIFWVSFLLLLMPQFHMFGLILIPAVVVVLLLCPVRLNFLWLTGGILAGLALYLPYLRGEMAHGWENTRGMFFGGSGGYSVGALKIFSAPWAFLINHWSPRWTDNANEYREMGRACFGCFGLLVAVNLVSVIFAAFLVAGAFLEIRKALRGFWRSARAVYARSPGILFLTIIFAVPLVFSLVGGQSFHARYCLVLLAPLFSLAAVAAVKWLATRRVRRIFFPILMVTTCANIWLVPAMYRFQGKCLEEGPLFIPSFRKLETVYQRLKAHAGKNRFIQVDDVSYLQALTPQDKVHAYASMIRTYVANREKENGLSSGPRVSSLTYDLCCADRVKPDDPAVAYRGQGIALVAAPASR